MANFSIYRETALPGTLQPNSIYLVAPPGSPDLVEMYVTGNTASAVKRIIDQSMIQTMIDDAVDASGGLTVVDTIAERDGLSPDSNILALVTDASDDPTVSSGAATYVYRNSTSEWKKVSESESMDVVLNWSNLQGKPSSSVSDIDDAVSKRHSHTNRSQLDKIGQDGDGHLTYDGSLPVTAWSSSEW